MKVGRGVERPLTPWTLHPMMEKQLRFVKFVPIATQNGIVRWPNYCLAFTATNLTWCRLVGLRRHPKNILPHRLQMGFTKMGSGSHHQGPQGPVCTWQSLDGQIKVWSCCPMRGPCTPWSPNVGLVASLFGIDMSIFGPIQLQHWYPNYPNLDIYIYIYIFFSE
jgi:hypothetical protein